MDSGYQLGFIEEYLSLPSIISVLASRSGLDLKTPLTYAVGLVLTALLSLGLTKSNKKDSKGNSIPGGPLGLPILGKYSVS